MNNHLALNLLNNPKLGSGPDHPRESGGELEFGRNDPRLSGWVKTDRIHKPPPKNNG